MKRKWIRYEPLLSWSAIIVPIKTAAWYRGLEIYDNGPVFFLYKYYMVWRYGIAIWYPLRSRLSCLLKNLRRAKTKCAGLVAQASEEDTTRTIYPVTIMSYHIRTICEQIPDHYLQGYHFLGYYKKKFEFVIKYVQSQRKELDMSSKDDFVMRVHRFLLWFCIIIININAYIVNAVPGSKF